MTGIIYCSIMAFVCGYFAVKKTKRHHRLENIILLAIIFIAGVSAGFLIDGIIYPSLQY